MAPPIDRGLTFGPPMPPFTPHPPRTTMTISPDRSHTCKVPNQFKTRYGCIFCPNIQPNTSSINIHLDNRFQNTWSIQTPNIEHHPIKITWAVPKWRVVCPWHIRGYTPTYTGLFLVFPGVLCLLSFLEGCFSADPHMCTLVKFFPSFPRISFWIAGILVLSVLYSHMLSIPSVSHALPVLSCTISLSGWFSLGGALD